MSKNDLSQLVAATQTEVTQLTNRTQSIETAIISSGNDYKMLSQTVTTLENELVRLKSAGGSGGGQRGMDHALNNKAIQNLKILSNDKSGFVTWNDKFVNASYKFNQFPVQWWDLSLYGLIIFRARFVGLS